METLTIGPVHNLAQNTVYALPARAVYVMSTTALQISNDSAFGSSQAVAANTPTVAVGAYVRCTTAATDVYLKAM